VAARRNVREGSAVDVERRAELKHTVQCLETTRGRAFGRDLVNDESDGRIEVNVGGVLFHVFRDKWRNTMEELCENVHEIDWRIGGSR
jgi:hypothetical protein